MSSSPSTTEAKIPAQRAVADHLRLLTANELDQWVALFATDCILNFPFAPEGMPSRVEGHEALLNHMRSFPDTFDVRFADLRFHDTVDPQLAVAEFRLTGTAVPTGKPYEQTCVSIVHTDADGLITRYEDYWNPLVAIEALSGDETSSQDTGVAESFGN